MFDVLAQRLGVMMDANESAKLIMSSDEIRQYRECVVLLKQLADIAKDCPSKDTREGVKEYIDQTNKTLIYPLREIVDNGGYLKPGMTTTSDCLEEHEDETDGDV